MTISGYYSDSYTNILITIQGEAYELVKKIAKAIPQSTESQIFPQRTEEERLQMKIAGTQGEAAFSIYFNLFDEWVEKNRNMWRRWKKTGKTGDDGTDFFGDTDIKTGQHDYQYLYVSYRDFKPDKKFVKTSIVRDSGSAVTILIRGWTSGSLLSDGECHSNHVRTMYCTPDELQSMNSFIAGSAV